MEDSGLTRYCGIGVLYVRPMFYTGADGKPITYGIQIRLSPSALETPASRMLQDGDILTHTYASRLGPFGYSAFWNPITSQSDFNNLTGFAGTELPLKILRGAPLPSTQSFRNKAPVEMPTPDQLQPLQFTLTRATIVNYITPEELKKIDIGSLPWRHPSDKSQCSDVAALDIPTHNLPNALLNEMREAFLKGYRDGRS